MDSPRSFLRAGFKALHFCDEIQTHFDHSPALPHPRGLLLATTPYPRHALHRTNDLMCFPITGCEHHARPLPKRRGFFIGLKIFRKSAEACRHTRPPAGTPIYARGYTHERRCH